MLHTKHRLDASVTLRQLFISTVQVLCSLHIYSTKRNSPREEWVSNSHRFSKVMSLQSMHSYLVSINMILYLLSNINSHYNSDFLLHFTFGVASVSCANIMRVSCSVSIIKEQCWLNIPDDKTLVWGYCITMLLFAGKQFFH